MSFAYAGVDNICAASSSLSFADYASFSLYFDPLASSVFFSFLRGSNIISLFNFAA